MLTRAFPHDGLVVFDELHKHDRWRNLLKGLYDTHGKAMQILVTGSARLLSSASLVLPDRITTGRTLAIEDGRVRGGMYYRP